MAEIFSAEWTTAWGRELASSDAYRQAAASWEGSLLLELGAAPELGLAEPRLCYLDLWHGECREARSGSAGDAETSDYVIAATPLAWRRILEGEVAPIAALMRGMLELRKGALSALVPQVAAARELVAAASRIDTSYPRQWRSTG